MFKRLAAIGVVLAFGLTACLTQDTGNPDVDDYATRVKRLSAACNTYATTMRALSIFRRQGALSGDQINIVNRARAVVSPVCTSPTPPDTMRMILLAEAAIYDLVFVKDQVGQ